MAGNKWVAVYADRKGRERERLVREGRHAVSVAVEVEDLSFEVRKLRWDGQTRDLQGRRVYA